jgi:hypothetical protein
MDYCEKHALYTHLPTATKPHTTNTPSKMDERLDPRIPARYFVPTQLRSGGGGIWLASCPIERRGILEIPYTWPRRSSWSSSWAQAGFKNLCNIASCHVTFLARESPRLLQKESPSACRLDKHVNLFSSSYRCKHLLPLFCYPQARPPRHLPFPRDFLREPIDSRGHLEKSNNANQRTEPQTSASRLVRYILKHLTHNKPSR